jgi:hypothetical protein
MRKKNLNNSKQAKGKVLKIIFISLIIFTLLFLVVFTYFLHLVFDPEQKYNTESLTQQHVLNHNAVIARLTRLLYQGKPGRVSVLILNQAEVNAVIAAISNSDSLGEFLFSTSQIGKAPKKRPYKVIFKQNRFDIKYSFPTDFYTPFGKNINLTVSGKPELDRKGVHVEKILHSLLKDYENDKIFKKIHEVIVKAYITPENNLVIYFYPCRIKNVLTEGF